MLELYLSTLSWSLAALIIGILLGTLTGLIPGFHVNNVALILLALSPAARIGYSPLRCGGHHRLDRNGPHLPELHPLGPDRGT